MTPIRWTLLGAQAERGVGIVPGTLFFPDGRGADTVRLSFSMISEAQIDDGIERVAALLTPSAT